MSKQIEFWFVSVRTENKFDRFEDTLVVMLKMVSKEYIRRSEDNACISRNMYRSCLPPCPYFHLEDSDMVEINRIDVFIR